MGCMKCGRDTREDQVFCDSCREDMARYPVKPNVVVKLPQRTDTPGARRAAQARRKEPTAEDRLRRARRRARTWFFLWMVTLALLAASLYPYAKDYFSEDFRLPGQNYSTFAETRDTTAP